jgi:hypothetical protein
MIIQIIALAILVEALTELFFRAAPIQGLRNKLITITPFLEVRDYGHLFECKYCTSFWVAVVIVPLSFLIDYELLIVFSYAIIAARVSNYIHIIYGIVRDKQMNIQLDRRS